MEEERRGGEGRHDLISWDKLVGRGCCTFFGLFTVLNWCIGNREFT
jgi:hypothetical protein